jgi:Patatin-like phospholipase
VSDENTRATDRAEFFGSKPANFDEVLQNELVAISTAREKIGYASAATANQTSEPLTGLAFSGGGIRSATFNLGVIQALAECKLLPRFDYLSTVSGGGYIGSWLSALIYRAFNSPNDANISASAREKLSGQVSETNKWEALQAELAADNENNSAPGESPAISHLRSYSNYLTPRRGLLKADTLASLSTYLRNTFLNLLILICMMAALLFLPQIIVQIGLSISADYLWYLFWLTTAATLSAFSFIGFNLNYVPQSGDRRSPMYVRQVIIVCLIILPTIAVAFGASVFLHNSPAIKNNADPWLWSLAGAIAYALIWLLSYAIQYFALYLSRNESVQIRRQENNFLWVNIPAILLSGAIGGLLFFQLFQYIPSRKDEVDMWIIAGAVTPAVLLIFNITITFHIGLAGRTFTEASREWWSRLGGLTLLIVVAWIVLFATVVYTLPLVEGLKGWVQITGLGWIFSSAAGIIFARSAKTGDKAGEKSKSNVYEWVALAAPYVFVIGLCFFLTYALQLAAIKFFNISACSNLAESLTERAICQLGQLTNMKQQHPGFSHWFSWAGCAAALILIAALLSWRVDINLFSIYQYYKNRLVRAYLGASRMRRQANTFTGFDMNDDLAMTKLQLQRPYPIINTALNLVAGKDLAWQQRKAAAFSVTPLFTGFQLPSGGLRNAGGYRRSAEYLGEPAVTLGQALTISGAAASPNMGYHSSPPLAFLMTVFNVRLGRWCGNPGVCTKPPAKWIGWMMRKLGLAAEVWQRKGPQWGAWYLIRELLSSSNENTSFVYLSDGGHFENLAIYELVRRRCKLIVVCDVGADKSATFADLGNAMRKCYVDLGVEIEINVDALRPNAESNYSQRHYAVGTIHYDCADRESSLGTLLYIKTSLCGSEPSDILNYAKQHKDFPHESTADQWFDEAQFESYRKLGHHIAKTIFASALKIARANHHANSPENAEISAEAFNRALHAMQDASNADALLAKA